MLVLTLLLIAGFTASAGQGAAPADPVAIRAQQGTDLLARGSPLEALAILEPLLDEPALAANPALHADVLYRSGLARFQKSEYPKALVHYQRARDVSRIAGERLTEARALFGLMQSYKNQGEYPRALEHGRMALDVYQSLADNDGAGRCWMVIASVQDLTGRYREALDSYQRAQRLFGGAKHTAAVRLLNEIGITYKNLGDYHTALDYYTRGLAAQVDSGDKYGQAVTLHNTAVLYVMLGEHSRAIDCFQRALAIAREVDDRRGQSILLGNLGDLFMRRGDDRRALEFLAQQLQLTRELGNRNEQALALKNIGDVLAARKQFDDARQHYDDALAIQREIDARTRQAATVLALADLALRDRTAAESVQLAQQALAIATAAAAPELEWEVRFTLGRAERAAGRLDIAIEHLREASRIVNDLRANVRSDSSKAGFMDTRQLLFHELAGSLLDAGRPAEALAAAEAARARAFADLLEQRQVLGRPEERAQLDAVRTALAEARADRRAAPSSTGTSGDRRRAAEVLDETLAALRADHREMSSLVTAESPAPDEIAELAARLDATLVEYLVTDRAVLAWVVSATGTIRGTAIPIERERLTRMIDTTRRSIDDNSEAAVRRLGPALRELHALLIAPLMPWLPASPSQVVVIIPNGPLAALPFAALENAAGVPMMLSHTLAAAPSISVYRYTRDKALSSTRLLPALVVADPDPPEGSSLARLPGAREEGRRVAMRLGASQVQLLASDRASEASVKRLAAGRRVLHFATHGLISPENPLASSLVLGSGEGEDGFLRADEVFALPLSADLVVLSGCSTGVGDQSGEGIAGLSRAFMYAGAPRVVVSQWDVSDRATAFLMDRFYAALARRRGAAAALREAQIATRERFSSRSSWAAFVLLGEPR